MGKGHNVGWMKRVSVSRSRPLLLAAVVSLLLPGTCALQHGTIKGMYPQKTPPADGEPVSVSSLSSLTLPPLSLSTTSLTSLSAKNFVSEKHEKDAIRSGTCKEDLYQHKIELDRQKIELDQLRKKLDEYKIELEQDASFLKSGGAELTVESSLPIVLESKMLRAGSIRGSTYQREEVGNPTATVNMRPPTNTKAEPCPGSVATAQQNQDSFSFFSFLFDRPPSSVAVSHRWLATTTATTEEQLKNALASSVTIDLAANISLTSTVDINGVTDLIIDGKGFEIDGQNSVRCFLTQNGAKVALRNFTITKGSGVSLRINIPLIF